MSSTQGRIEFLLNELQQRTEQLAISQEHVAKLQDQLRDRIIDGAEKLLQIRQPRSTSDHQLASDIEALTERVSNLEFAAKPGYFDVGKTTSGQHAASLNLNAAIKQEVMAILDRETRIGGILSKRS